MREREYPEHEEEQTENDGFFLFRPYEEKKKLKYGEVIASS